MTLTLFSDPYWKRDIILDDFPIYFGNHLDSIKYRNIPLSKIFKNAVKMINNAFENTQNIQSILPFLFYVPKKDLFIIILRTHSLKSNKKHDYYAVEFTYECQSYNNILSLFENVKRITDIVVAEKTMYTRLNEIYKTVIHIGTSKMD